MSLILLGILNSQVSPAAAGAYDLLESSTLSSPATSLSFSNLDAYGTAGYKHLQLRMLLRGTTANNSGRSAIKLNSSTGSLYVSHESLTDGSFIGSGWWGGTETFGRTGRYPNASNGAGQFGAHIVDIPDAWSSDKFKTMRTVAGLTNSLYNQLALISSVYMSTSAINALEISCEADNFETGTRVSIYGVK